MQVAIRCPDTGDTTRFGVWFVRIGEEVREGERIAEVLIPGVAIDVLAPVNGTLTQRHALANRPLDAVTILGLIDTGME